MTDLATEEIMAKLTKAAFLADNASLDFTDEEYDRADAAGETDYLRPILRSVLELQMELLPRGNFRPHFEVGEEVELLHGGYAGNPQVLRPAVVTGLDLELRVHTFLRVKFDDDGEERQINPDVMRRRREKK